MPKIKTRKAFAKRIRVTNTGKLMRAVYVPKAKKRKVNFEDEQPVSPADRKEVRRALGI